MDGELIGLIVMLRLYDNNIIVSFNDNGWPGFVYIYVPTLHSLHYCHTDKEFSQL